jgi:hypothetical protein
MLHRWFEKYAGKMPSHTAVCMMQLEMHKAHEHSEKWEDAMCMAHLACLHEMIEDYFEAQGYDHKTKSYNAPQAQPQ